MDLSLQPRLQSGKPALQASDGAAPAACVSCPSREGGLCSGLKDADLGGVAPLRRLWRFRQGEVVARAGERLDAVMSIVSGSAILSQVMGDGREQIIALLLSPDVLGRPDGLRLTYDVVAASDLQLCVFSGAHFAAAASRHTALSWNLLQRAGTQLDAARGWMTVLGRKSARERVATFLSMLAARKPHASELETEFVIELPLTRQQIVQLLALTQETVSRCFSSLAREGIIELPQRDAVIVVDREGLLAATGGDGTQLPV